MKARSLLKKLITLTPGDNYEDKEYKFAKKVGVTSRTLRNFISGASTPTLRTALRIDKLSQGSIAPHMWVK